MFDIFIKYVRSSHQLQNSLTEVNVTVHSNNTWRIDCTPLPHQQIRSSRDILGYEYLPVSMRRLCEPVRKRVILILSISSKFICGTGVH